MIRGNRTGPTTLAAGIELRGLTGLRIFAALWVVVFHLHFTPLPGVSAAAGLLGPLLTAGALGVDLFFVLSGFVIAHAYLDRLGPALRVGETAQFVWARACRIWPAYVLVFNLFGVWLVARLLHGSDRDIAFQAVQPTVSVGEWVRQMFMVQLWSHPYFDGASWVGSTWSISAEWLAYLLFPVTALVFFRLRRLPAPLLALGALAMMAPMGWAYLTTGSPYFPWSWLVRILCGFSGGVLAYLAVRKLRDGVRVRRGASVVAVVAAVVIVAGLALGRYAPYGRAGVVIVLFPLLVAALALADRGPAMLLSKPLAVYGGHVSYALYLVHIPMFEVYWLAMRYVPWLAADTLVADLVCVGVAIATLPVAALVHRAVEEPARWRLRRLVQPKRTAPQVRAVAEAEELDGAATAPSVLVAAYAAARAGRPAPRHAASAGRPATLAAALASAHGHVPAHRAERKGNQEQLPDFTRAAMVRARFLHAGG